MIASHSVAVVPMFRKPRFATVNQVLLRRIEELYLLAKEDISICFTGESGCGKTLLARDLHEESNRAKHEFRSIDCPALQRDLAESALFGHVKGAYTGASHTRDGLIRSAHQGTVFFDEIADLPLVLQAKLLVVLEERIVNPVGSDTPHPVDVRWLSATNRNLEEMVEDELFREDLLYRLCPYVFYVPPLRERPEDISLLAIHFFQEKNECMDERMSQDAIAWIQDYSWPGNVRQLRYTLQAANIIARSRKISIEDLSARLMSTSKQSKTPKNAITVEDTLETAKLKHIASVVKACNYNQSRAAKRLKIGRSNLATKIKDALDAGFLKQKLDDE